MFLGKLFKKDYRHYMTQGEKFLSQERYADARCSFQDALERCPADAQGERAEIEGRLQETGNRLAQLNLIEGDGALNGGEPAKAQEYFNLALQLAHDAEIREIAEKKLKGLQKVKAEPLSNNHNHHAGHAGGCSSCKGHGSEHEEIQDVAPMGLSAEDTFHLLVQPLPGDLPTRYSALGKEFAEAYLLIHDGNDRDAFPILQELHRNSASDVVMYELALIMFRAGRLGECKDLLDRALAANPTNPLCYLSLVQLAMTGEQFPEALSILQRMLELDILTDQASLMIGDVHAGSGDHEAALAQWSESLTIPTMAKSAAERIVPLLNELGRGQEAQFVAKRYLKGCC
ncbi:hypothetical protein LPW11_19460 [Geomonas sp. RF6]|uniref:tetratricopeptide repeat protein n=1 Tax=Geomonas sp. RF6 TaxID=2897342 RepID=UPI001E484C16|nr:tetratricopeptide repeat protein [Geomonas sp. RF6]UFS70045.1 hypothetical protein LPW11_19460 [Geomonas sp. RF6]